MFQGQFFRVELFWSILRVKRALEGSGGILSLEFFERLQTVVAMLLLFEQFLGYVFLKFFVPKLSVSPSKIHFVRTFSISLCVLRA